MNMFSSINFLTIRYSHEVLPAVSLSLLSFVTFSLLFIYSCTFPLDGTLKKMFCELFWQIPFQSQLYLHHKQAFSPQKIYETFYRDFTLQTPIDKFPNACICCKIYRKILPQKKSSQQDKTSFLRVWLCLLVYVKFNLTAVEQVLHKQQERTIILSVSIRDNA